MEWIRWEIHPWRHGDGSIGGLIIFSEVITSRKETEQSLRLAEQKYRDIVEQAVVGVFQSAPDGRYLSVNPALARMLGYESPQELLCSVTDIDQQVYVDPERRAEFKRLMQEQGSVRNFECQVYRKDRSKVWLSVDARAIFKDGVVICYEGTNADVTERKLLQSQFIESQKMEAIGRLAGGIAHDFNNAIGITVGYSTLLKERLAGDEKSHRYADEIGKAGQRAASLTRQLLAFGRTQVVYPIVLDLNSVATKVEVMLQRMIGEDIEIIVNLDPELGQVKADPGQIEQIMMNLAVNARDAMPDGGRLVFDTANAELHDDDGRPERNVPPGQYVMFSVSDNGCGMGEDTKSHLFEPFFTTKDPGKGTGLGLSTVYGIVKQNRGHIWVSSELGQGTCFKVYLPRVDGVAQSSSQAKDAASPTGSETILLVEDDEAMRELTRACLEGAGYRVLDVPNGDTAIKLLNRSDEIVHLLLTDVIMPGMNGRELADRVAMLRPGIKRLYVSGYTADLISQQGISAAGVTLVEKPFTRDALLSKVREVLDSEGLRSSSAAI
ncbi:MAG: response regulator [Acidobacteriaceae bacterium]|nr:response regulator [Acidobacteriaceae bacterium]